ncbi:glycosyltransferase [bacterium]|nr:glycosyltransferase [bacterium]
MVKSFVTLFPFFRDHHFYKDPGQVPYRISREGYEASIVRFLSDDLLPVTEKHISVSQIKPLGGRKPGNLSLMFWLFRNSRKTEILNLFHLTWQSLLTSWLYKRFNRNGFVWIKMDNCHASGRYDWEDILERSNRSGTFAKRFRERLMRSCFSRSVDLWSVEDEGSRSFYESHYPVFRGKIITVFNGHCADILNYTGRKIFGEKEKIIVNAGRLGTHQKATDVLLEAFRDVASMTDYDLHLAGPMEPGFIPWYEAFLRANPDLKQRIVYHGALDAPDLYSLFDRSRVLCMPSRYEGLALVFCEAMYFGNAVVTTRSVSVADTITDESAGEVAERSDHESIAGSLLNLLRDPAVTESSGRNARQFAEQHFSWPVIIRGLTAELEERLNRGRTI